MQKLMQEGCDIIIFMTPGNKPNITLAFDIWSTAESSKKAYEVFPTYFPASYFFHALKNYFRIHIKYTLSLYPFPINIYGHIPPLKARQ